MEKEFVPYKLSLRMKQLRFDEPCFSYYMNGVLQPSLNPKDYSYFDEMSEINTNIKNFENILAPLFQQAFRWFREEYNLRGSIMDFIDDEIGIEWDYEIAKIGTDLDENGHYKPLVDYSIDDEDRKFNTYEEAELACLDKLIKIVENKSEQDGR
jgi:hypothetical protein